MKLTKVCPAKNIDTRAHIYLNMTRSIHLFASENIARYLQSEANIVPPLSQACLGHTL